MDKKEKYYEKLGIIGMLTSMILIMFTGSIIIPLLDYFKYIISGEIILIGFISPFFFFGTFFISAYIYLRPDRWLKIKRKRKAGSQELIQKIRGSKKI